MTPNYVAKKSLLCALNLWLILFFWLIIPLIIQIIRILDAKFYTIEFYNDKVVTKSGVFSTHEFQNTFMGIYSVSVYKPFLGRIFDYGDIRVDCPGPWDINTDGIKDPDGLKKYLETKITSRGANIIFN